MASIPDGFMRRVCLNLWLSLTLGLVSAGALAQGPGPRITLTIEGHSVTAEVAATMESRMRGLMHREKLGKNDGMLFVFDEIGYHSMWMKNTLIPLSVAFMDEQGRILNIADMEPHSERTHGATGPARYALETNVGWFRARNITPGMRVKGLEKAPKGQ